MIDYTLWQFKKQNGAQIVLEESTQAYLERHTSRGKGYKEVGASGWTERISIQSTINQLKIDYKELADKIEYANSHVIKPQITKTSRNTWTVSNWNQLGRNIAPTLLLEKQKSSLEKIIDDIKIAA